MAHANPVSHAPGRDTRSATKITPAASSGNRERQLVCTCCEQGFTLELPPGSPDPGAHCFQCRQECDWPGQCSDLSASTHTTA